MKINTIEKCINIGKNLNDWEEEYNKERVNILKNFPASIVIEGSLLEIKVAINWCLGRIGNRNTNFRNYDEGTIGGYGYSSIKSEREKGRVFNGLWTSLWYLKTDYDYGFFEFFFKDKNSLAAFTLELPNLYAEGPKGRWKTDGSDKFINIDEGTINERINGKWVKCSNNKK